MNLLDIITYCYENITPFQAAISLGIIFLFFLRLFLRDLDIPPGPRGSPLFGYWPYLKTKTCHLQLKELTKKYGDVFSLRVSGKLFIHLGSHKAIREAHLTKSECFEGRFEDYTVLTYSLGDGVAFTNGAAWKVLRKFFLMKFREYGMNAVKENVSGSVYDALKESVDELKNTKGRPVKIADVSMKYCMRVIRRIIFNDQGITMEEFQELLDQYTIVAAAMSTTNFMLMGTFAKYFIFPFMPKMWAMRKSKKRMNEISLKVVERHKSQYIENPVSDLVDSYLKERDARKKAGDPTAKLFTDRLLAGSLEQFITDGVLTIGLSMGVFFSFLVQYPEEQEKVYQEILDAIGPDRLPTVEDKIHLPYTNAFIYEVLRFTDFFPLYPSVECSKETTIQGYKIPEGSVTLINIYAAHRNPETYDNPDEFNPSRFLSSPNHPKADLPLLFGIGKRSCIGEAFSMIQIFLLITTIVQNFRLAFPENKQNSENMFWSTERVEICVFPRSQKSNSKRS